MRKLFHPSDPTVGRRGCFLLTTKHLLDAIIHITCRGAHLLFFSADRHDEISQIYSGMARPKKRSEAIPAIGRIFRRKYPDW